MKYQRVVAKGSTRVVYVALAGNAAIAVAKFFAYALSGSSAILTEAIHSLVDTADQTLLLVGEHRARRSRDPSHPLGYGMEMYFWSFVVAMMVFGAGGLASIYEGVARLRHPAEMASVSINLTVLAIAAVFEGLSFLVGFKEYRRAIGRHQVRLWRFITASKDPSLFATLLEDGAALVGIALAAAGVVGSTMFKIRWADGVASISIGVLLASVAIVLANETRSLIAGESVAPPIREELRRALDTAGQAGSVADLATLHLGPRVVLVAITLRFDDEVCVADWNVAIRAITRTLKAADDRIAYVYVRPAET